jgi:beta-N-acetylhexosaminidase
MKRRNGAIPACIALAALIACAACGSGSSPTPTRSTAAGPTASLSRTAEASPSVMAPSAAATTATETPAPADCAQTALAEMTPSQLAGQLVMSGTPVRNPGQERTEVAASHLGGVFLAGRSSHSPATVRAEVARLPAQITQHASIKPLISTDQEGGKVQTLHGGSWISIAAGTTQGSWSESTLASRTRSWARQLKAAGVTMDLAPVADTVPAGTAAENPPIGVFNRQYGSTPAAVAARIATVTTGMRAAGLIPTVKHFPGLGRVRANTDTSTKAVDGTTSAADPFLTPFTTGIRAGAGAVMVSSASYPRIDRDQLAVFSSAVITGLLRQHLGYHGVVITDDLGKAVAVKSVSVGQRAVRFISAGGDVVLTVIASQAPTMVAAIAAKARTNVAFRAQVNASVRRVLALKQQFGLLSCR